MFDQVAPRLGQAVKFALFDAGGGQVKGPFFRVRHTDPGNSCGEQAELVTLLHDCQMVIAGSAGNRLTALLSEHGVTVVRTEQRQATRELVIQLLDAHRGRVAGHRAVNAARAGS